MNYYSYVYAIISYININVYWCIFFKYANSLTIYYDFSLSRVINSTVILDFVIFVPYCMFNIYVITCFIRRISICTCRTGVASLSMRIFLILIKLLYIIYLPRFVVSKEVPSIYPLYFLGEKYYYFGPKRTKHIGF